MVWHFIGVYIINRILHGPLEIQNFSFHGEKNISQCTALTREIFFNTRREISYLHAMSLTLLSPKSAQNINVL